LGFELRLEAYFPHEQEVLGHIIPAQSVLKVAIRREDVYRVVPTYREAFDLLQLAYQKTWMNEEGTDRADDEHIHEWYDKYRHLVLDLIHMAKWNVQTVTEVEARRSYQEHLLDRYVFCSMFFLSFLDCDLSLSLSLSLSHTHLSNCSLSAFSDTI
jgi:hypothetical protein